MKKLLFLFLLLPMVTQAASVEMSEVPLEEVEGNGMKVYITTHQLEEQTDIGVLNCTLTTTYYKFGGKLSRGAAKACNFPEYNCTYLGMCPTSGSDNTEVVNLLNDIANLLEAGIVSNGNPTITIGSEPFRGKPTLVK